MKGKLYRWLSVAVLGLPLCLTLSGRPATAADSQHGAELHNANCMHCHSAAVYERDKRIVTDREKLNSQVRRCSLSLEVQWFDEDIEDVVAYLNEKYYKF
jgi:cytochrome c2